MECYCCLRNIQDLLSDGKSPHERRFGMPFNGPVIPCGAMVEYHPISAKDISRLHQFGSKVLPGIFTGYVLYAVGIWKGDIIVADIEELEDMDASELHASVNAAKKWKLHFPGHRGNSQNLWRRTASENIHLNPGSSRTLRRTRSFSRRIRRTLLLQTLFKMTRHGTMRKPKMTSGLFTGDFSLRHHVEP